MPNPPDCYGLLHGDFHICNYFIDGNNVWVFDFDEACYGFFMHDIASLCHSLLLDSNLRQPGQTSREVLNEKILPYFKIGYQLHVQLPQEHWDLFDLFVENRVCHAVAFMLKVNGTTEQHERMKQFFNALVLMPDVVAGIDMLIPANGKPSA